MKEVAPAQIGELAPVVMLTLLGGAVITTLPLTPEVQPAAFVTVKVYVPELKPETVVVGLLPVLVVIVPPKSRDSVQLPDGKPLNTTLPVAKAQVGWVMVPTTGGVGVVGADSISTLPLTPEVQPATFVTVKVYVPAVKPDTVVVGLLPVVVVMVPPKSRVSVQLPDGKPLNTTLPVAKVQVGWVMVPTVGGVGVEGEALISTLPLTPELPPAKFVTVTV